MLHVGTTIHSAPIEAFGFVSPVDDEDRRAHSLTLFDLVDAVSESCESEAEVIATVRHLIASGQVRLLGVSQPR